MRRLAVLALVLLPLAFALALAPGARGEEQAPAAAPPPVLAPSWRSQAEVAYGAKDWSEAIVQYRRWLEADPRDDSAWYNLACCYALDGQPRRAVDAFETAVRAGWRDTEHPLRDPDLATVRDDPAFRAALARAGERGGDEGPERAVRHWLPIRTLGTYLALLPSDYETSGRAYPLVVILHGAGSSELGHGRLADRVGRESAIYVVPRAPYPYFEAYAETRRPAWIAQPSDARDEAVADLEPAAMYVDTILAAVDDARRRYRTEGERVHVLGHSMGAFYANTAAALHPERIGSVFAYAGGIPDEVVPDERLVAMAKAGVVVWLVHGRADPVVEPLRSEQAQARLTAAGVSSTLHLLDGVDHTVQDGVIELARRWLAEVVARPSERPAPR